MSFIGAWFCLKKSQVPSTFVKTFDHLHGAGWQLGPQLQEITKVEDQVTVVIEKSKLHFRMFIAFDIPIFNLYNQ